MKCLDNVLASCAPAYSSKINYLSAQAGRKNYSDFQVNELDANNREHNLASPHGETI